MVRRLSSLQAYSKTVEAIYDCALDPANWGETLRSICQLTDSPNVAAGIMDYGQQRLEYAVEYGHDPTYWKVYLQEFEVNPLLIASHAKPVGEVYTERMLGAAKEIHQSRLHHEWGRPQRLGDFIGVNLLRAGRRVASINSVRKEWQPSYSEHGLQYFRLLAPHICRAFAISDAVGFKSITARALEATLDALATAVYLADCEGRVVYMNRAAERQIKTGSALRIVSNRLAPVNHEARAAMTAGIAGAIADEAATPTTGITVALPDTDRAGLVATILPLDRGRRHALSAPIAAVTAVFVQDPSVTPSYPGEAFAKLYGLTGAELRVLLAMAPGLGVRDAGAMLGISEVTARTHLQHIYSKTGTSKQTELLNLLRNTVSPVKPS